MYIRRWICVLILSINKYARTHLPYFQASPQFRIKIVNCKIYEKLLKSYRSEQNTPALPSHTKYKLLFQHFDQILRCELEWWSNKCQLSLTLVFSSY